MTTEVKQKIIDAYKQLIKNDFYLLSVGVNERSITHKMAEYIQSQFPDYHVDCEYNRNGPDQKRLDSFKKSIQSDDADGTTVYPDIIVHHRNTQDNLVVIEAKKSTNNSMGDKEKLQAYKDDLGYRNAYFIIFPIRETLESFTEELIDELIEEI